jgi:hypothetical protein
MTLENKSKNSILNSSVPDVDIVSLTGSDGFWIVFIEIFILFARGRQRFGGLFIALVLRHDPCYY